MQAVPTPPEPKTSGSAPQPSPLLELALAYAEELSSDDLGLDFLLDMAGLCWKAGLEHKALDLFDRALRKANGFRYDFRRASGLVSCARAFRECGMTSKATEALEEAVAIYRAGSPEFALRGVLMQLVAEYAASEQWECALSLASSCADVETRNEAMRLLILQMAKRELWSEAARHVREHYPPGHPARARVVVTLASVALGAGKPESEQGAIIAQLADPLKGYS